VKNENITNYNDYITVKSGLRVLGIRQLKEKWTVLSVIQTKEFIVFN